jgi:hypothetical protein
MTTDELLAENLDQYLTAQENAELNFEIAIKKNAKI